MNRERKAEGVEELWKNASKRLEKMTPAQGRRTLIDSGILTEKGKIAPPYKRVVVDKKK
ncbi:hypothetical protein OJ996_20135 [Luteolibacter sp. GHJ8]|uniref:Uncharacterized protein n=1 Tax=Luteolibacter rhizosphaerae TaxID=2989719 RepID=A0ABT3G7S9_9BACT|nr:hypothetical protein [Luteolibacter rhizosphaerae]MCW1915908.1 hypothetical protein [Luteolibacter rhizosphaerae]